MPLGRHQRCPGLTGFALCWAQNNKVSDELWKTFPGRRFAEAGASHDELMDLPARQGMPEETRAGILGVSV